MLKYIKNKKTVVISLLIVIAVVLLDQITKSLIVNRMTYRDSIEIISNFFWIVSHRNHGAAWGVLQEKMLFFYLITIMAFGIFIYLLKEVDFSKKQKVIYNIAIPLLIGGTIGNFIDRIRYQYVVDFLDFLIFGYDFPVFNVADMALVVGTIMFAVDILFFDIKKGKKDDE